MRLNFSGPRPLVGALVIAATVLGTAAMIPTTATADATFSSKGEERTQAWITGYTFWDNSPPGSAEIARPVIHDEAGGTGTYEDPITIAVGWDKGGWHFAPGTRVYLEDLDKYAVVEDLCGACKTNRKGRVHMDIYVGGESTSARTATSCAQSITAVQSIILHPAPGYPVRPGELAKACPTL